MTAISSAALRLSQIAQHRSKTSVARMYHRSINIKLSRNNAQRILCCLRACLQCTQIGGSASYSGLIYAYNGITAADVTANAGISGITGRTCSTNE